MRITKTMREASVEYLEKYLSKENRRISLPLKHVEQVKKLIDKKRKENKLLADHIVKSPIYKLAIAQVIRKGKSTFVKHHNELRYDLNANEVILTMLDIVTEIGKPKNRKLYREYVNG